MTLKQKTKALVYEGPKVVSNAVKYGVARIALFAVRKPNPSYTDYIVGGQEVLDQLLIDGRRQFTAGMIAAVHGLKLKKAVARFKSTWKDEPLVETTRL